MKLLQKRQIDSALATQRKSEIDNGIKFATSVDNLRRARVEEEKSLKDYRKRAFTEIQVEIDSLLEDKANLLKWNTEARAERVELLKPLDEEWKKVNHEKVQLEEEKRSVQNQREELDKTEKDTEIELEKVSRLVLDVEDSRKKVERTKKETTALKDMAQKEYEIARHEHESQTEAHEKAMIEVNDLKVQYEVGLNTLKIETKLINEKEADLISREQHLQTQIRTLQIARGILNHNDSLQSDD